ncbi:pro-sigmaK processing inhibitor BofA family protein [Hespellia stercorisuis]|uniref:Inhibitor of the pro-sigma K processing machinery n=1 Tax=Hespellia stercorisuis DSM 15480 TaxID=1121950 RepID=A0A1M6P334_9FIRM|nr:pro-sigmaK processing inhibitor BofA family protein [Hespellia stercorisuis]SHK02397.1 inhibitor of the pro-sigma K processing machinery [Hespellia stercorisuis DSM 15480]
MERVTELAVNFIVRSIVGMGIIFLLNEFLKTRGMDVMVGLNAASFLTSGTLGIPGVGLLYGIALYKIL